MNLKSIVGRALAALGLVKATGGVSALIALERTRRFNALVPAPIVIRRAR